MRAFFSRLVSAEYRALEREVTERRRVEQSLRQSEARYRAVSELTSDYTYSFRINEDGAVIVDWVAGAFARITGYTPEEVEARGGGLTLIHPEDLTAALERVQALISGQADTSEFRIIAKDGEVKWLRETGRPVWDESHRVIRVVGAAQDITARKHAEELARERQSELAHVLRVGIVGEMAAGLAHEINQPLSAILSYAKGTARRLRAGTGQPAELLEAMEEIAKQALRADQIIRRLRSFTRKGEPQRENADLNILVREVAHLAEADARGHGVSIHLKLATPMPTVCVDRLQIEQVILNLVRNGLEAMRNPTPERSVLSIETSICGETTVEIAVNDLGEGLDPERSDKMFDPFFTTKPDGMGMGLSISRTIIEAHGGRLWASSNSHCGATFRFTLPLTDRGVDAA